MEQEQEAAVLEMGLVSSPEEALRPPPLTATMDLDDAVEALSKGLRPFVQGKEEEATFRVRPGVTLIEDKLGHRVVEVILKDRVYGVSSSKIAKSMESGTFQVFCEGLLGRLRSRLSFEAPIQYRRVEVLREILAEIEPLARDLEVPSGTPGLKDGTAPFYQDQIALLKEAILKHLQRGAPLAESAPLQSQRRPFERKRKI